MMPSLTAFFYPCFMGYLLLSAMLHRIALRHKPLLYVATAFPVGAGLCSLILYFSYLIFAPNAKLISTTFSVIATVCLLVYRITRPAPRLSFAEPAIPKMSWRDKGALRDLILPILSFLLFAVTFATVLYYYSLAAPLEIHGGGDVRYFWSLKAKFFFRAPEAWKNML